MGRLPQRIPGDEPPTTFIVRPPPLLDSCRHTVQASPTACSSHRASFSRCSYGVCGCVRWCVWRVRGGCVRWCVRETRRSRRERKRKTTARMTRASRHNTPNTNPWARSEGPPPSRPTTIRTEGAAAAEDVGVGASRPTTTMTVATTIPLTARAQAGDEAAASSPGATSVSGRSCLIQLRCSFFTSNNDGRGGRLTQIGGSCWPGDGEGLPPRPFSL